MDPQLLFDQPDDRPAPASAAPPGEQRPQEVELVEGDDSDAVWDLTERFVEDPAEATDRMLEVIAAVDFLRRGDRRGFTLWAAIEEALQWWVAERTALLDGYADAALDSPRFDERETLRSTLVRLVATAGQDEPVHVSHALQEALRHWSIAMADRHNDGQPWPAPAPRHQYPVPLRLVPRAATATGEPPDLIA
ncbi:MAG: hypothetical protein MUE36_07200 [Acidimicrobiales bacterium]|jgi:hypothetical protein|nr:hypothetical protein [Acidimicrobiales bacterium]